MANGPCDDDDPEGVPVDESDLRLTKILAALEGLLTPREPAWARSMARLRGRLEEGEPAAEVAKDVDRAPVLIEVGGEASHAVVGDAHERVEQLK